MATPRQAIEQAAVRRAARVEDASRRFGARLGRVLRQIEREVGLVVATLPTGPASSLERGSLVAQVRVAIRRILVQAGFQALAEESAGTVLDRLTAEVLRGVSLVRVASIRTQLEALRLLASSQVIAEGDRLTEAVWQATMRGVFADRTPARILTDLAGVFDRSEAQIRTLYDTSVAIYGRQVEALTADPGPETPFLYVGPQDEVTRPFCRAHAGKVFRRSEIERMRNGQLPHVFLTGGGYNCRHSWIEVSRFSAALEEAA